MQSKSQLDQIDDYYYAVERFVYKGLSIEQVKKELIKRGADQPPIGSLFQQLFSSFPEANILQRSKKIRLFHFIADSLSIAFLRYVSIWALDSQLKSSTLVILIANIAFFYYFLMELTMGQTIGKTLTGSIVVHKERWQKKYGSN